ncbi:hypothetical protein FQZ97_1090340 [compost metagenome]
MLKRSRLWRLQHRQLGMIRKVFLRGTKQAAEVDALASATLFQRANRCMPSSLTGGMKLETGQVTTRAAPNL